MNANEHYVSQVLLRRFTTLGHLQSYRVRNGTWKRESPKNVFSDFGYNQLLVCGQVDNTLEQAFSKVETPLPKTFEALEEAANRDSTKLPPPIFENMCWYCAFIKRISPFAKAAAPADFVIQLDMELEKGGAETLQEVLNLPEEIIQLFFRGEHALGRKVIIHSRDFLQVVYRIQFRRKYGFDYSTFRHNTTWTVCNSPVDLPISDVALTEIPVHKKAMFYGLPIGPRLLLKGQIDIGGQKSSTQTNVNGATLSSEEAELWFEAICLSAVNELVSKDKIPDVLAARSRAKAKGIAFTKITDPDAIISAGQKNFTAQFGLVVVSLEEYVKFIHSFIQPPDK